MSLNTLGTPKPGNYDPTLVDRLNKAAEDETRRDKEVDKAPEAAQPVQLDIARSLYASTWNGKTSCIWKVNSGKKQLLIMRSEAIEAVCSWNGEMYAAVRDGATSTIINVSKDAEGKSPVAANGSFINALEVHDGTLMYRQLR